MTFRLSTGLRDSLLDTRASVVATEVGTGLAFVDGGAGEDSITDSGNGLVTAGFQVNDRIYIYNPTTAANKTGVDGAILTAVAAGTMTFATGSVDTAEAFTAGTVVMAARGGSLADLFKNGVMRIYTGAQPADADTAETGTLLVEITESSGSFTGGAAANGLEFAATAASGVLAKSTAETWSGAASATGTAGWFRLYANAYTTGASTTAVRLDGSCGTSGAQLTMGTTTIQSGATQTVDTFTFTLPTL